MAHWSRFSFFLLTMLVAGNLARAETRELLAVRICAAAETEASSNGLDKAFFVRLLWRESAFDPNVVSDKGAQGIAQFMPGTASRRGLVDPFDPIAAVKASANYLADLKKQFGNIGLAAAAYNAGEQRVIDWLAAKGHLPAETQDYVSGITGHAAEEWQKPGADFPVPVIGPKPAFGDNCRDLAMRKQTLQFAHLHSAPRQPWGAVLAVNFNEDRALAQFRRLKLGFPVQLANREPMIERKRNLSRGLKPLVYVMLGAPARQDADQLCANLGAQGVPCLVRKN